MSQKRQHKATFARDNREGGYNVRIVGPNANLFANRENIPVTRKDGSESLETLGRLLWTGADVDFETEQPTGLRAALYQLVPKEDKVEVPFT